MNACVLFILQSAKNLSVNRFPYVGALEAYLVDLFK